MLNGEALQHVSDTAIWIATYRALESRRKRPLFQDPFADLLVGGRGKEMAKNAGLAAGVHWSVVIRTCVIDDYLKEAIARGTSTILNLGAGLDTRPYRMQLPRDLLWIEVDFPDVLALKESALKDQVPSCQLRRLKMDLADGPLRRKAFAEINSQGGDVLILTEGVIPYMTADAAGELARDLFRSPRFKLWVTDYFSPVFMAMQKKSQLQKVLKNTPFQFFPENWEAHYKNNGWQLQELRYLADVGKARNRPAPMPWRTRLAMMLGRGPNPDMLRRALGYAILTRVADFTG